jgi:hypothetical protein
VGAESLGSQPQDHAVDHLPGQRSQGQAAKIGAEDPERKPVRVRRALDQEHGQGARDRRQRRERVIDLEVTVGRQRYAGGGRHTGAVRRGWSCCGLTEQVGEHGRCGCGCLSGISAARQNQPLSHGRLWQQAEGATERLLIDPIFFAAREAACGPRQKPWSPATAAGFSGAPVAAGYKARRQLMTRCGSRPCVASFD